MTRAGASRPPGMIVPRLILLLLLILVPGCGAAPPPAPTQAQPPTRSPAPLTTEAAAPEITLALAGDVMLARGVSQMIQTHGPLYPWGDLLPLVQSADLFLVNLECVIAASGEPFAPPRVFYFRAHPGAVETLVGGGVDYVTLANNHTMDYQGPALLETMRHLDAHGIAHAGADLIIFSIHWGPNMRPFPMAEFKAFARAVLDAGADLFHGHSAHVFQGVEIYDGKPILYDTGDLTDDYYVDPVLKNDQQLLFLVTADKRGVQRVEGVLVLISSGQVNLARGTAFDQIHERLRERSAAMGTEIRLQGKRLVIDLED